MTRARGGRTRCTAGTRAGRLAKAEQFLEAASIVEAIVDEDDLIDAYITLCVHAGIAAADVVCCARLGEHASGQSHEEAKGLLARADKKLADHLGTLLGMKTFAGYSSQRSSKTSRTRAKRAADALVQAARLA